MCGHAGHCIALALRASGIVAGTHMEMMAKKMQKGRYLFCPSGSYLALYDG